MSKLYYFNPEHDLAIANGDSNFQAPESAFSIAEDLSLLPCWIAEESASSVLSDQKFTDDINVLGLQVNTISLFSKDKIDDLIAEPWGWDMAVRKFFLQNGVSENMLISQELIDKYKELSHRRIAGEALSFLKKHSAFPESMPEPAVELRDMDEVNKFAAAHKEIVLKAPWSGSGKGIFWSTGQLTPSISGWSKRVIEKQGSVMGEIAFERVQDFAMEFRILHGEVSFAGYSLFFTEGSGIYKGNYLISNQDIEDKLTQWVSRDYILWIKEQLCEFLKNRIAGVYNGFVGVDMFVYNEDGQYKIDPVVEINLRMTMGLVARLIYDRYVCDGSSGLFIIDHLPPGHLLNDHKEKLEKNPMVIENGRFKSGYTTLCPIFENTVYRVSVTVSERK